jgi:hypothetical protein
MPNRRNSLGAVARTLPGPNHTARKATAELHSPASFPGTAPPSFAIANGASSDFRQIRYMSTTLMVDGDLLLYRACISRS